MRPVVSKNNCANSDLFHSKGLWTSLSNVPGLVTVSLAAIMAPGLTEPVNFDLLQCDYNRQTNSYSRIAAYLKRLMQFWH